MFSRRESSEVKCSDAVISFSMKKLSYWLIWNFLVTREKTCISRGRQIQVVVCCFVFIGSRGSCVERGYRKIA